MTRRVSWITQCRWATWLRCLLPAAIPCLMAGCGAPYAYVHADRIAEIPLGQSAAETHIIRVDYTAAGNPRSDRMAGDYTLCLLDVGPTGKALPAQVRAGLARGVYLTAVQLNHDRRTDDSLEIRLYRRGFKTLQITTGYKGERLKWRPARSLNDREQAIDMLFAPWVAGTARSADDTQDPVLEAADLFRFRTEATLCALNAWQLGVREYNHLLNDASLQEADRERVTTKVSALQKLAQTPVATAPEEPQ